jgi:hypothetical protein
MELAKMGKIKMIEDPATSPYVYGPKKCYSGGAGLVSTVEDYARFLSHAAERRRSWVD